MGDNDDEDDEAAEHRQKRKSKQSHAAMNNQTKDDPKQTNEEQGGNDSPPQPGNSLTLPRIFANCTAFICIILIVSCSPKHSDSSRVRLGQKFDGGGIH